MKIENQVVTIEQAKKLKELGVEQKVLYQWKVNDVQTVVIDTPMAMWIERYVPPVGNAFYAAFTVAELGVMLPSETHTQRTGSEDSEYDNWEWVDDGNGNANGLYNTEVEARAAMLIYLLENNLTTAEEVNQRLTN